MSTDRQQLPELLRPSEVAELLRVDPKTVSRWASEGKLRAVRTPGGHRRIVGADIQAILDGARS